MPRIPVPSKVIRGFQYTVENDFTGGLKTEFTGLNFPENACTQTANCTFFHTGAVFRRNGFDQELNNTTQVIDRTNKAISTFVWSNAGGDGNTKIYVKQVGTTLTFYNITNASVAFPLSTEILSSTISLTTFQQVDPSAIECQYAAGNGYLFVFNSACDPFYCTYNAGTVTASSISIKIRDFVGIPEPGVSDTFRAPAAAETTQHVYNLQNQGWSNSTGFTATSSTPNPPQTGIKTFTIQSGLTIPGGSQIIMTAASLVGETRTVYLQGQVTSYTGSTLVVNITGSSRNDLSFPLNIWTFASVNTSLVLTWIGALGSVPSNSDVWWQFKNSSNVFDPATTIGNVTLSSPAPKGYYVLNTFNQDRGLVAGIASGLLTPVTTSKRPKTGTWFAGRVWYTGVDASFPVAGDEPFYTWTENIYFSQIVDGTSKFEKCYQVNDPTSENLFDLLPSDGGVITIQGSGSIYKLVPITNGLIVFAANGIWFISGSQGIGFTATDYTVSKISAIQSISSNSYVDILGYPMFWNEEGIYTVGLDSQAQGISVNSITLNTIKQFYDAIPVQSKKFARGSYNPITGQVQWIYRSTNESDVTSRYNFDSALTFSMFSQAFYPWTLPTSGPQIHDVTYVVGPGGVSSPLPLFKYLNSTGNNTFTFAEERDNINWKDWNSTGSPVDYTSFFVTAYKLHGDAKRKFQPSYVFMYSDNAQNTAYKFNGKWNFAISGNSGKYSIEQVIFNTVNINNFSKLYRRHRLRGRGTVLQLQIASVSGKPFHIDGWAMEETQASGV